MEARNDGPAGESTVYSGGPIYTMNALNEVAEALAVKDGRILAVGSKAAVAGAAGKGARTIDLRGKALLPGFIDGHSHFPIYGIYVLTQVDLNVPPVGTVTSIAGLLRKLSGKAKNTPSGEWIVGFNYNDLAMQERRHPLRAELDSVSMDHPIFIRHVSGHLAIANSKALALANIDENTPNPESGYFRKGSDNKLDGVLEGSSALAYVDALIPGPSEEQLLAAIRHDSANYARSGVTTAQNGGVPSMDPLLLKAAESGDLKLRLIIWPAGKNAELLASYGSKRSGSVLDRKGMIMLGAAKLFADGSPQGYTAHFSRPYHKQLPGKPDDYRGFPVFGNKEELIALVKKLHDDNWQVATHTNGDQAIQDMIDAYGAAIAANPRKDHRHILNHCQFTRPDQVAQIARYGLWPSFFVTHTWFWGDIHRELIGGPERAAHISPCKAALDNNITFTLHDDTPITPISPLMSVFSAVNRLTLSGFVLGPDQRIGVLDALRAVTINSARMQFVEDRLGSLEPGKLADLVILDRDPARVDPVAIKDINVLETIVEGTTVYKA